MTSSTASVSVIAPCSNSGGARPADWHFTHLYDPRSVQLRSVMPSYAHLFGGSPTAPSQEALDNAMALIRDFAKAQSFDQWYRPNQGRVTSEVAAAADFIDSDDVPLPATLNRPFTTYGL